MTVTVRRPPVTPLRRTHLRAWLLLLLRDTPSHGYAMRRALLDRGLHCDAGTVYRLLAQMRTDGLVMRVDGLVSMRAGAGGGPERRCYSLTAAGRLELDDAVTVMRTERTALSGYLTLAKESR